ncbi:MAG: hypothetical protein EHM35_00685 [Planctomycetaceae bacterium]|nr:MAG: hypothetical protein EHM35_00685 [Planctomycetaceae bacterium]
MAKYRGTVVHQLTEQDVGKPLGKFHTAFLGWGTVAAGDVGKLLVLDPDGRTGMMENDAQRDKRRAAASVNRTDKGDPITETSWPKHLCPSVECRKRDLVIRISDWTRQSAETGEPAYDVEVYVAGVYDWNLSKTFTTAHGGRTKAEARREAATFAAECIRQLLK